MKKLFSLSFVLLFIGCSGLKRSPSSLAKNSPTDIKESVELSEDQIFDTPSENTHVLAEARADDVAIKQSVGNEIDEETQMPEEQVPYARDFLVQKKTKRMKFWIEYFTQKQRARFQRFLNNGEEYRHHIEEIFAKHGLPKELYYVGLIESGYYLTARSHAKAVGPWQFMPGTGKQYGLKVTHELDERQDLFKATTAAAKYFKNLHNIFSSWELALAAYNAGEYGIIRRILKHGTRDFYHMSKHKLLPQETINYVPKVLAAMHVVNNAEKYGFTLPKKEHRLFDHTELKPIRKNVPLRAVAEKLNVDVHLLKKLNPELRRASTPRRFAGTYYLRVPKSQYSYRLIEMESDTLMAKFEKPETRKELKRRTASTRDDSRPRTHKVRRGETLISLSRKFKMTPRELASLNHFKSWKTRIRVGQVLKLERDNDAEVIAIAHPKLKITNRPIVYKVKSGDNLTDLARVFDISARKIKSANKLKRTTLMVGQKIVLPSTQKGIYTVKRGEYLNQVARKLNQPVEVLTKLNSIKKGQVYAGQKLIVDVE
jgi:membrane-bound lytic murein transglycosylase D